METIVRTIVCSTFVVLLICIYPVFSGNVEADDRKCEEFLGSKKMHKFNESDCDFESDNSGDYIVCVLRLSVEQPRGSTLESEDSEDEEVRKFIVYIDYYFKMELIKPSVSESLIDSGKRCTKLLTVGYQKLNRNDGRERKGFPMASSLFKMVANTEFMSSDVSMWNPEMIGMAEINANCCKSNKCERSSCIHKVHIKYYSSVPGSVDDMYSGKVDFTVTSFGYSHLSSLNPEFPQSLFEDKTRKGKILLKNLPGKHIKELRLSRNKWNSFDDELSFPSLEVIDLSLNDFEEFKSDNIGASGILKEIDFSEANLKYLPNFIKNQSLLKILKIGGNPFDYDERGAAVLYRNGYNFSKLEILNISGFLTRFFEKNTLPYMPLLKELDASNCKMFSIDKDSLISVPSLEIIRLSKNSLSDIPSVLFAHMKNLKYVDLSSNKLREGQGLQFAWNKRWPSLGMQLLDMSSNSLASTANLLGIRSQVKKISLSNNALKDLKGVDILSFYGEWVKDLDLSSNLIPVIHPWEFEALQNVTSLSLSENQFNCEACDMPYFQKWLNFTGRIFVSSVEDLYCASPPEARRNQTKVLGSAFYDEVCPDVDLIVGSSLSGMALFASMVGGLLYIYRFEASYVLHMIRVRTRAVKGEGKPHSECIYDAFVSYSGGDRTWVLRVLQPGLELSDQRYQLCLHDRDFTLGGIITQNIVDSIDKSRKTILILSDNFVGSQWCRWEMEMANHKLFNDSRNFLVLIELERLNRKTLPQHLRFLMDTRTYLEWPIDENDSSKSHSSKKHSKFVEENQDEMDANNPSQPGNLSEQSRAVFWKRLQVALGDSLYIKEMKAKKEAEIAIKKTKERDLDIPMSSTQFYETTKDESETKID